MASAASHRAKRDAASGPPIESRHEGRRNAGLLWFLACADLGRANPGCADLVCTKLEQATLACEILARAADIR